MAHLLLVEDDAEIRRALIRALTELDHVVASTASGLAAIQLVLDTRPDLVVLDLGLPDVDGAEILRMMRSVSRIPVIVATARDQEAAIIEVLNRGADDYLTKPFSAAQLDARIRAVLRRSAPGPESARVLVVGGLMIDLPTRTVTVEGTRVELSPREFDLLAYLAARPGAIVNRRELVTEVWRQPYGGADKTIDVHLSWLRRKLGEDARAPRYLHTVRGVGVRLAAPAEPGSP